MMKMYRQFEKDRDVGNFATLPELHALSSGLKAVCTWITADGIEACRRCCGGHGYSLLSGLPTLFASYVQNVTWEGDNNIMCLQVRSQPHVARCCSHCPFDDAPSIHDAQTARYLVKAVLASRGSGTPPTGSAAYLAHSLTRRRCSATSQSDWQRLDVQVHTCRWF